MSEYQPTIFITVSRGYIMRNVIRSGVLEQLKKSGARIVILLYNVRNKEIPQYLKEEFEDDNVIIDAVSIPITRKPKERFFRAFCRLVNLLVYNNRNWKIDYIVSGKSKSLWTVLLFKNIVFSSIGKIQFVKTFARYLDNTIFFA